MPEGPAPKVGERAWRGDEFAASLAGRSAHTRDAYEHDVAEFVAWAERGGCASPSAIDHRTLRRYLAYLDTRGFARASIARKAAAVRSYLRYLRRHGVIDHDPGRDLRAPKGASRLPRVAAVDEADDLLDAAAEPRRRQDADDDPVATAVLLRDLAVLEVLYGAGLRVAECCGLRRGDCDLRTRPRHRARQGLQGAAGPARRAGGRRARAPGSTRGRAALATPTRPADVGVPQPARPRCSPADARRILERASAARRADPPPARPPARVRYPPARRRSRPPGRAGAARPRRPGDDPDLHPRDPRRLRAVYEATHPRA